MPAASSFAPVDAGAERATGWTSTLRTALDSCAFTIPLTLGCVAIVFGRHAPALLPAAVLATLLGLALLQLACAASGRPMVFSVRVLESATLAALVDSAATRMGEWGIPDSPQLRVTAIVATTLAATVVVLLLHLLRAGRIVRFLPTPVFAGFNNAVAAGLLIAQFGNLRMLLAEPGDSPGAVLGIAVLVFASSVLIRRWLPRWPATAAGLALGLLAGLAFTSAGTHLMMVAPAGTTWSLPVLHADFAAFAGPDVPWLALSGLLAGHAAILGALVFLSNTVTAQLLSHHDDLPPAGLRSNAFLAAAAGASSLLGALPLSGTERASVMALRRGPLSPPLHVWIALLTACVALTGVLGRVPLAAVAGALLCEALFIADRPFLAQAWAWLRRRRLPAGAREDLALVAAVTVTTVVFNMVAAIVAGVLLGLVLFAVRNARRPLRAVLSGAEVSSNCARSRSDIQRLARWGHELVVVELEGDLFFGAVQGIESQFLQVLENARVLVIDWSSVDHVDTSVVGLVRKIERAAAARDVALFHVDPSLRAPAVAASLQLDRHGGTVAADADHALEAAENRLLALHGEQDPVPGTTLLDAVSILRGFDEGERAQLERTMPERLFRAGEIVMRVGEPGDELMVVLQGSASVLVPGPGGVPVRVAGVRRGGVLGEIAFLDQASRSATVRADEDLIVAVLRRAHFDELGRTSPDVVQKLLTNLALDLAARLRHTSRLATARQARR